MFGVVKGVQYCNVERVQELNDRIYNRNIPSRPLEPVFDPIQAPTRYVRFPALDCRKQSNVPIAATRQAPYNQMAQFNPGTNAPFSGYAKYVDQESRVQNMFMAQQKGNAQSQYIPSSKSDLYQTIVTTSQPVPMTNQGLFHEEQFNAFNPNACNLGNKVLNNHTRQQVKNLGSRVGTNNK